MHAHVAGRQEQRKARTWTQLMLMLNSCCFQMLLPPAVVCPDAEALGPVVVDAFHSTQVGILQVPAMKHMSATALSPDALRTQVAALHADARGSVWACMPMHMHPNSLYKCLLADIVKVTFARLQELDQLMRLRGARTGVQLSTEGNMKKADLDVIVSAYMQHPFVL